MSGNSIRGLLFDLDGVLIDSLPSIHTCMNHALRSLGHLAVDRETVRPLIGPPLHHSAGALLGTDDPAAIDEFITRYRARYDVICERQSLPTPAMPEVVATLHTRYPLAVATSKPLPYARRILAALGVDTFFTAICGPMLEARRETKAEVIAAAMAAIAAVTDKPPKNPHGLWMIGDRAVDVEGARHHGIATIGVTSGMGGEAELKAAGAQWLIEDLRGLMPLLARSDFASPSPAPG